MDNQICILKTYGKEYFDLGDTEIVTELISKLKLPDSKEITIDLSGCLIDYPATSIIIDKVLYHLDKYSSRKKLRIIIEMYDTKEHLLNILFMGSRFINITDKFRLKENEWINIIEELKTQKNIIVEIIMPAHNMRS